VEPARVIGSSLIYASRTPTVGCRSSSSRAVSTPAKRTSRATLAYAFGYNTFDDWVEYAPQLSLLRQGILDQPCTETLVVNGLHDSVFPISDCYLLLEHGTPKSSRFFDAAHMGYTRDTDATIIDWIASRLHI
jgi:hypothetical protein